MTRINLRKLKLLGSALFVISVAEKINAHGGHEKTEPALEFTFKWAWDPTSLLFLILAVLYAWGLKAYRGKAPVAIWQISFFYLGIACLVFAYLPMVDTLADQLFSAHMIQHLFITSIGVPLIIFGIPYYIVIRGLAPKFRNSVLKPLVHSRASQSVFRFLQKPLLALLLYEAVFWFWHIPYFYNAALLNDLIHSVEHACMALAAMNMWRVIIDPAPMRSSMKMPVRILYIGLMMTTDMALSAALTYSERVWYAYESLPMPAGWNFNRLEDQQLGGLIMWVPGGLIWLGAMAGTFFVWMKRELLKDQEPRVS